MAARKSKKPAIQVNDGNGKLRTADSFANFMANVGHGTGNQNDGSHYGFNPVTRNRVQMEWCYRGSWIAGRVVDCVARDMTREGVDIKTSDDPEKIGELKKEFARMRIWDQLCETIKWARLYGGACAFMMIEGQDPSTPLRLETVRKGQFKGLLPLDRWLLQPSLQDLIPDFGSQFGKPKFYQTVPDSMGMPNMTIHHSRMIRVDGVQLPYWQRISENLWGQSVLERMWDRLIMYDSATTGAAQLTYKAHLRVLQVEGLREIIGMGGQAMAGLIQQVNMIKTFQSNEGITLLDAKDKFEVNQYGFGGLDSILIQFGEQLCGAVEIPAVRLFGQSPAGFSSGDSDLRNYYDTIKQNQVSDLGPGVERLYKLGYISVFGTEPPEEFDIEFEHLWQLDELQKSTVTSNTTSAINMAFESQMIDRATAMTELKELSQTVGTFSHIDEKAIKEAESDPAPSAEVLGLVQPRPELSTPTIGGGKEKNASGETPKKKSGDSAEALDGYDPGQPRDPKGTSTGGQWTTGGPEGYRQNKQKKWTTAAGKDIPEEHAARLAKHEIHRAGRHQFVHLVD